MSVFDMWIPPSPKLLWVSLFPLWGGGGCVLSSFHVVPDFKVVVGVPFSLTLYLGLVDPPIPIVVACGEVVGVTGGGVASPPSGARALPSAHYQHVLFKSTA